MLCGPHHVGHNRSDWGPVTHHRQLFAGFGARRVPRGEAATDSAARGLGAGGAGSTCGVGSARVAAERGGGAQRARRSRAIRV